MKCREALKYLYAFVDGELETADNLDVLEHLNMCPDCTKRIRAEELLRASIERVMSDERVTGLCRTAVLNVIAREASGNGDSSPIEVVNRGDLSSNQSYGSRTATSGGSVSSDSGNTTPPVWRIAWPSAVAAVITAMVIGLYAMYNHEPNAGHDYVEQQTPNETQIKIQQVHITENSEPAIILADHILDGHLHCCAKGAAHHDESLPHDGLEAAKALGERLGYPVLRCNRLVRGENGQFESARQCKLIDAEGNEHAVGHLIYRLDDKRSVSLISVARLQDLDAFGRLDYQGRSYVIVEPSASTDESPVCVVAFDCPAATHIVCAPVAPQDAVELAAPMKLARLEPDDDRHNDRDPFDFAFLMNEPDLSNPFASVLASR